MFGGKKGGVWYPYLVRILDDISRTHSVFSTANLIVSDRLSLQGSEIATWVREGSRSGLPLSSNSGRRGLKARVAHLEEVDLVRASQLTD